jgi:capsular exopolysaccharide synthesis family protein
MIMQSITTLTSGGTTPNAARNMMEDVFWVGGVTRRRWRLIAVVNLVFLTVAALYLAKTRTVYKTFARLLVMQQGERINVGGPNPFGHLSSQQETLSTHMLLIRSPVIISRALEVAGRSHLSADSVISYLKVHQPAGGGKVLDLEYQADTEEEARSLMNAIISSYDQFLKDNYQKDTRDVITLIVRARDDLSKELKELERAYLEFRRQNSGLTGGSEGRTLLSRRLEQWDQAAGLAVARALQLRTQLELAKKYSREGVDVDMIKATLRQLGGIGDGSTGAIALEEPSARAEIEPGTVPDPGATSERLLEEAARVEFQRRSFERLVEHMRSERAVLADDQLVDEREVRAMFHADPEVADHVETLAAARAERSHLAHLVRNRSDPAVRSQRESLNRLEEEYTRLWRQKGNAIRKTLGAWGEQGEEIRRAELDIWTLRSQESLLRERATEARAEELARLDQERDQLMRDRKAADPEVANLDKRIAALKEAEQSAGSRKARGLTETLIDSLEKSLQGVETMRAAIEKRLDSDIVANHEFEITQLVESNLRSNLERQRTLFDSVAAQLKQAQIVSDYGSVTAQTINPTKVTPMRPSVVLALILALAFGSGLGTGASLVVEIFEARIRTISDLQAVVHLPIITLIPRLLQDQFPGVSGFGLLSQQAPRSLAAELYKSARTHLEMARRNRRAQTVPIPNPNPREGKSVTSSNLAICQANAGRKTLLIDADLRCPTIHTMYNLKRDPGLSRILIGEMRYEQAVQSTGIPNLDVITSGDNIPNPSELLSSPSLGQFLDEARASYDIIIIDTSPLLAVTDAWIVSAMVDELILVLKIGEVRRPALEQTMKALLSLGSPTLGVIINATTREQVGFDDHRFTHLHSYGYAYGQKLAEATGTPLETR